MIGFWRSTAVLLIATGLAACSQSFETSYSDAVSRDTSANWDVVDVQVNVPRTLSVSERNGYAPNADIVWQEEEVGDRHMQVQRIVEEAARNGAGRLNGVRPVVLAIEVDQFHALTKKARYGLKHSGVHNIGFRMVAVDAETREPLTEIDKVQADLAAYVGQQAVEAEARGSPSARGSCHI